MGRAARYTTSRDSGTYKYLASHFAAAQDFLSRREGYTPTRLGTEEATAAAAADAVAATDGTHAAAAGADAIADDGAAAVPAADGGEVTYSTGIDDFDVVVDAEGSAVDVDQHQHAAAARSLSTVLQQGGTLVSAVAGGGGVLSDYDRDFAPLTHPAVFPYGEGGRPAEGMSEEAYFRLVLERQSATGRGDNVGMLLTFFDIRARHDVNATTSARACATPEVFAQLDRLPMDDLCTIFDALRDGACRAFVASMQGRWRVSVLPRCR